MTTNRRFQKNRDLSRRTFLERTAVAGVAAYSTLSLARTAHAAGSDVIKVGLIGCGGRGTGAAGNAMNAGQDIRLIALADLFADKVKTARDELRKLHPDQMAVDDEHCFAGFEAYEQVIASGVDAVVIACTSHFHPMFLKAAIDAGKHVFVEKPVAIDPAGVRMAAAACEAAKRKNLSVVSGFCWRYNEGASETVQRLRDGAIGEIVAVQANRIGGPYVLRQRKPQWSEMEYQFQNWYHFNWLSGSDPVQNLVHQIDNGSWALGDAAPEAAWGIGGRQVCTDPNTYGDELDHHTIVYEYPGNKRFFAFGRHIPGCYSDQSVVVMGTKGRALMPVRPRIEGEKPWRYRGSEPVGAMYDKEHKALFQAIRTGQPINNGQYMRHSSMLSILGEMVCCTGQRMTWDDAVKSRHSYALPKYGWDVEPPVKPGPDGGYPAILPGITKLS